MPLGILGAVYLHEYGGKRRVRALVRFMAMVMTGVPSIVMGLFVYTIVDARGSATRRSAARSRSPA